MSTIQKAGRYSKLPANRVKSSNLTPFQILVKEARKRETFQEWCRQELKEGNFLHRYLEKEKANTDKRYRSVARQTHGFKQNNKSEWRRVADIPLLDWIRWKHTDKDFFNDDSNLRSLRRDNPDARVYI